MITVQNLSKKYTINASKTLGYNTLIETFSNYGRRFLDKIFLRKKEKSDEALEEFWALKGVSFELNSGDRLGIIGKNGAGKSTLLKLLSRVTFPTEGKITFKGRLASLLEVGTGFHLELSARENIYLNGSLLGMSQKQIVREFDSIVAFSEIEKFLDTPVKRFSSGMYLRLGFSIAAHVDPDIFIIDEALAVGDAQFQAKCLKKIQELNVKGRTIVFVSHDINSIKNLCNRGLYLVKGKAQAVGNIQECIETYEKDCKEPLDPSYEEDHSFVHLYRAEFKQEKLGIFFRNQKPLLEIEYEVLREIEDFVISLVITDKNHHPLAQTSTLSNVDKLESTRKVGYHYLSFQLDTKLFYEGEYYIKVTGWSHHYSNQFVEFSSIKFTILSKEENTLILNPLAKGIDLDLQWELDRKG